MSPPLNVADPAQSCVARRTEPRVAWIPLASQLPLAPCCGPGQGFSLSLMAHSKPFSLLENVTRLQKHSFYVSFN